MMMHTIDLSGARFGTVTFNDALVAFRVPEALANTLSMLVWGVTVLQPDQPLWQGLPHEVREQPPSPLYFAGWGTLTFHGVTGGKVCLAPYQPSFSPETADFFLRDGEPVRLTRTWQPIPPDVEPYCVEGLLDNPFGWLTLDVAATGMIQLLVDPNDFVTYPMFSAQPAKYGFDRFRERQLA